MKYLYLFSAVICSVFCTVCSCAAGPTGEASAHILGKRSEAPVFLACNAVSETEINFRFSQPVTVVSLNFSPALHVIEVEDGSTVRVNFSESPGAGERVIADLLAEDPDGNTINVLVPVRTRNDRIPRLCINEIRTEYSKPKCEFIELKTFQAGNLGALRVFIAGNSKAPLVYEFPSIETATDEYITLHLRTTEESNRDELGTRLDESGGADSSPSARDLWIPGADKLLRKTDIVYLLDQDERIIDAILLSENADPWWNKDYLAAAAELISGADAWKSAGDAVCAPTDAVISGGTTLTRTVCRDETLTENSRAATDWYITANSGATPGKPNNQKRYIIK